MILSSILTWCGVDDHFLRGSGERWKLHEILGLMTQVEN
jgi:hypothetical protein